MSNGTIPQADGPVKGDGREQILERVRLCVARVPVVALANHSSALDSAGVPSDPSDALAADVVDLLLDEYVGELAHLGDLAEVDRIGGMVLSMFGRMSNGWLALARPRVSRLKREAFAASYGHASPDPSRDLIEGVLVAGQAALFGGRSKVMKTTLAAAAVASLLSGTPFLGRDVRPVRGVVYLTCERPPAEVRGMVGAFCGSRVNTSRLVITSDVSLVRRKRGRADLRTFLASLGGPGVVFLDPLYLLTGRGGSNDLAAAGDALRRLVRPVVEEGHTPVLIHHLAKSSPAGEWPALDDLNGAGVAEFARSWLLLARETEYAGGGVHDLLAVTGTSRGGHGRLRVRVDEGDMTVTVRGDGQPEQPATLAGGHRPPARKRGA